MSDLRHAVRILVNRPGFTALAILTLALGIGANTAVFTVVHGVLLKPLPYPSPERIVRLWEQTPRNNRAAVSHPNFADWRQRARSFEAMAAYASSRETVLGGSEPVFASVVAVSDGFFRVFGVNPAIGRTFGAEEARPTGTPAVVVSRGFWQRTLGSSPALDLLQLRVDGVSCRVVGVMPDGFAHPAEADVWFPLELFQDSSGRTAHNYAVVARLKDGVVLSQGRAEMDTLAAALRREHPGNNDALSVTMVPLQDALTGASRDVLVTLLAAVGLVLLIACANVAGMLLAAGEARRAELAIRAALGAGRARIARQLFVEHALLSAGGAAAGLLIASWLVRALLALPGAPLPRADAIGVDRTVLLFTLALAVTTPLLFGLLPAFQLARAELRDGLAASGRGSVSSSRARVRWTLIAGQVAVALLLLVGASLLVRSFWNLLSVDTGFDRRGVLTAEMSVPAARYPDGPRAAAVYQALLPQVRTMPGVRAAGAINQLPLAGTDFGGGFRLEGAPDVMDAGYRIVTDGYFDAMRIPLRRGRLIDAGDTPGRAPAAVVNEAFVTRYLPSQDPIGSRFAFLGMDRVNPTYSIVGVVANVRHRALMNDVQPEVYLPYLQQPFRTRWSMTLAVRAERADLVAALAPALREAVRAADGDIALRLRTLEDVVEGSIADRRFTMLVLAAFAAVALLLATAGIYGVVGYSVATRTREIGIRIALGAAPRSVVAVIVRSGMTAVAAGIGLGLAGAFVATRALRGSLVGVTPLDPLSIGAAVLLLAAVACAGACMPARRAMKVDPLVALRMP